MYQHRSTSLAIHIVVACGLIHTGCGSRPPPASESGVQRSKSADSTAVHGHAGDQIIVPALPPDTFPADYRKNWAPSFRAPRDIVTIIFRPGTSVERKAEAIAAIRGRVVGGTRFPPGDPLEGIYLVRIPDTGTVEAAIRAVKRLEEFPFVFTASLLIEA